MMVSSAGMEGKWQMESSQSYRSSGLDYSEDTFESFSEEDESCWQQEGDPLESCHSREDSEGSAVSDVLHSTSQLAGQSHTDEQPGAVDSAAVEGAVMGKWIHLQNLEAGAKQDKSVIKAQGDLTGFLAGEGDALSSFCSLKIRKMLIPERGNGAKARKLQQGFPAEQPHTSGFSCPVPHQLMSRLLLKNIRETVQQVIETQIHECSVCPDCQEKEAELARIAFLRQKKMLMESALIQEKLEEQIYSTDVLTLLGETLRTFPKPSEGSQELMAKAERSEYIRPGSTKHNSRT